MYGLVDGVLVPLPEESDSKSPSGEETGWRDPAWYAGETYLRLAQLDLADEAAIANFCTRFGGPLGIRNRQFDAMRDVPGFEPTVRRRLEAAWPEHNLAVSMLEDLRGRILREEGIEDFRFGALCVRDLVRARRILLDDDDGSPWEALPAGHHYSGDDFISASKSDERYWDADAALRALAHRALAFAYSPRFMREPPAGRYPGLENQMTPDDIVVAFTPIYGVCCAELLNHVTEQAPYRECANDQCGRIFVVQAGRAAHGQHRRRGVVQYCTPFCAKAQLQRESRARKRAART